MKQLTTILFLLALAGRAPALPCPEQTIINKASESLMTSSPEQARALIGISALATVPSKPLNIGGRLQMLGIKAAKVLGSMAVKNSCHLVGRNVPYPSAGHVHVNYEMSLKRGRLPN